MSTVAVIQARLTSTRLPGKVLLPLGSGSILDAVLTRIQSVAGIERLCIAVPGEPVHDPVAQSVAGRPNIMVVRGAEHDVLARVLVAARATNAKTIVRVTSDCPLIDPAVISTVLAAFHHSGAAYASTALESGYPTGYDIEVIAREALEVAGREAADPYEREHVTPFIWRRPERFRALYVDHKPDLRSLRLVVDTAEDYEMAKGLWRELGANPVFGLKDVLDLRDRRPDLFKVNANIFQTPYVQLPAT